MLAVDEIIDSFPNLFQRFDQQAGVHTVAAVVIVVASVVVVAAVVVGVVSGVAVDGGVIAIMFIVIHYLYRLIYQFLKGVLTLTVAITAI